MDEFAYNNAKKVSINHSPFELNCGFYHQVLFKGDVDLRFRFYLANKLAYKLRELILIYCQNLFYVQEL